MTRRRDISARRQEKQRLLDPKAQHREDQQAMHQAFEQLDRERALAQQKKGQQ